MSYQGPNRRQHRVFVTRNTEYHVVGNKCVAVRDVAKGCWQAQHSALGSKLEGGIARRSNGALDLHYNEPDIGDLLAFSSDVLTSPLTEVRRPSEETVAGYNRSAA